MDEVNELLILRAPELRTRLEDFLDQLQNDSSLRLWYVNEPAQVIMAKLFPDEKLVVTNAEINRGNRLLYSILTNRGFRSWAAGYEEDLISRARGETGIEDPRRALETYLAIVDRASIHADLATAVAQHADAELVAGLTWTPGRVYRNGPGGDGNTIVEIETVIYAVAVAAVAAVVTILAVAGAADEVTAEAFTRAELATAANNVAAEFERHAIELRSEGRLMDYGERN